MKNSKRPKARELKKIYLRLITPTLGLRLDALSDALQWWDSVRAYMQSRFKKDDWTLTQKTFLVQLEARRALAAKDITPIAEREQLLIGALKLYERLGYSGRLPQVAKYYRLYQERRIKMEQRQDRLMDRYAGILTMLTSAFQPKNYAGKPVKLLCSSKGVARATYDPFVCELAYSRACIVRMQKQYRAEGPLAVLLHEMPVISRAAAQVPDGNGGHMYDDRLHLIAVWRMQDSMLTYLKTADAPKRLIARAHDTKGALVHA